MAKRINITDKLDLDSKPEIEIRGEVFTVNDEAETILKIIELGEKDSAKSLREIGRLLFAESDFERIIKLPFDAYKEIVKEAIRLVTGTPEGEAQTPAMT